MAEVIEYQFLPWVRTGMAAGLTAADTLGTAPMPALARLTVTVPVLGDGAGDPNPAQASVAIRGPGDVTGIDPGQIVRTYPRHLSTDAEPNFFPLVEFDRPDFPWLFTPAATAANRLRPWLVLVTVDRDGDDPAVLEAGRPLPRLRVPAGAADQLPDLADSWLWAHAQVIKTAAGQAVGEALRGDPRLNLSRLVCPRRLEPNRRYLACVVPTFEEGRLAGLGEPVPSDHDQNASLAPAWTTGGAVILPVYHHFEFATGAAGDFETLARRLQGRILPEGVGTRSLDVSHPGSGLPEVDDVGGLDDRRAILALDGALRPVAATPTEWEAGQRGRFVAALTQVLDTPARLAGAGGEAGDGPRTVAPPIYGQWHAAVTRLGEGTPPPWLAELNLDPRTRVAAGLGTEVVRANQEDLMARAWRQVGQILAANRLLRQAQLARQVGVGLRARHLATLRPEDLLQVTSAVHRRVQDVLAPGDPTLRATVGTSRLPDAVAANPFRRLVRPRGPLGRTGGFATDEGMRTLVRRLGQGELAVPTPLGQPDGTVALATPSAVLGPQLAAQVLAKVQGRPAGADADAQLDQFALAVARAATPLPRADEVLALRPRGGATAAAVLRPIGAVAAADLTAPGPGPRMESEVLPVSRLGVRPDRRAQPPGGGPIRARLPGAVLQRRGVVDVPSRLDIIAAEHGLRLPAAATLPGMSPIDLGELDRQTRVGGPATVLIGQDVVTAVLQQGELVLEVPPLEPVPPAGAADGRLVTQLTEELVRAHGRVVRAADAPPAAPGPVLQVAAVKDGLLSRLDPEVTVVARVSFRLAVSAQREVVPADPLEQVMATPVFNDAMWRPLKGLSQDWLLPGLHKVPPDTVALVETNPTFVVSYLVGLNHEMAGELLWGEFPTDQRGTSFTRFWGRPDAADIGVLHRFTGGLTANLLAGPEPQIVLLVRGELLRRYPGAIVFAAHAVPVGGDLQLDESTFRFPRFRGTLDPDVSFLGFDLTRADLAATGEAEWWFVIAEQITEPRFGVDEYDPATFRPAGSPGWTFRELTWAHLGPTPQEALARNYPPRSVPALGPDWGRDAATQAHVCYQNPVRVAIRARSLLSDAVLAAGGPHA